MQHPYLTNQPYRSSFATGQPPQPGGIMPAINPFAGGPQPTNYPVTTYAAMAFAQKQQPAAASMMPPVTVTATTFGGIAAVTVTCQPATTFSHFTDSSLFSSNLMSQQYGKWSTQKREGFDALKSLAGLEQRRKSDEDNGPISLQASSSQMLAGSSSTNFSTQSLYAPNQLTRSRTTTMSSIKSPLVWNRALASTTAPSPALSATSSKRRTYQDFWAKVNASRKQVAQEKKLSRRSSLTQVKEEPKRSSRDESAKIQEAQSHLVQQVKTWHASRQSPFSPPRESRQVTTDLAKVFEVDPNANQNWYSGGPTPTQPEQAVPSESTNFHEQPTASVEATQQDVKGTIQNAQSSFYGQPSPVKAQEDLMAQRPQSFYGQPAESGEPMQQEVKYSDVSAAPSFYGQPTQSEPVQESLPSNRSSFSRPSAGPMSSTRQDVPQSTASHRSSFYGQPSQANATEPSDQSRRSSLSRQSAESVQPQRLQEMADTTPGVGSSFYGQPSPVKGPQQVPFRPPSRTSSLHRGSPISSPLGSEKPQMPTSVRSSFHGSRPTSALRSNPSSPFPREQPTPNQSQSSQHSQPTTPSQSQPPFLPPAQDSQAQQVSGDWFGSQQSHEQVSAQSSVSAMNGGSMSASVSRAEQSFSQVSAAIKDTTIDQASHPPSGAQSMASSASQMQSSRTAQSFSNMSIRSSGMDGMFDQSQHVSQFQTGMESMASSLSQQQASQNSQTSAGSYPTPPKSQSPFTPEAPTSIPPATIPPPSAQVSAENSQTSTASFHPVPNQERRVAPTPDAVANIFGFHDPDAHSSRLTSSRFDALGPRSQVVSTPKQEPQPSSDTWQKPEVSVQGVPQVSGPPSAGFRHGTTNEQHPLLSFAQQSPDIPRTTTEEKEKESVALDSSKAPEEQSFATRPQFTTNAPPLSEAPSIPAVTAPAPTQPSQQPLQPLPQNRGSLGPEHIFSPSGGRNSPMDVDPEDDGAPPQRSWTSHSVTSPDGSQSAESQQPTAQSQQQATESWYQQPYVQPEAASIPFSPPNSQQQGSYFDSSAAGVNPFAQTSETTPFTQNSEQYKATESVAPDEGSERHPQFTTIAPGNDQPQTQDSQSYWYGTSSHEASQSQPPAPFSPESSQVHPIEPIQDVSQLYGSAPVQQQPPQTTKTELPVTGTTDQRTFYGGDSQSGFHMFNPVASQNETMQTEQHFDVSAIEAPQKGDIPPTRQTQLFGDQAEHVSPPPTMPVYGSVESNQVESVPSQDQPEPYTHMATNQSPEYGQNAATCDSQIGGSTQVLQENPLDVSVTSSQMVPPTADQSFYVPPSYSYYDPVTQDQNIIGYGGQAAIEAVQSLSQEPGPEIGTKSQQCSGQTGTNLEPAPNTAESQSNSEDSATALLTLRQKSAVPVIAFVPSGGVMTMNPRVVTRYDATGQAQTRVVNAEFKRTLKIKGGSGAAEPDCSNFSSQLAQWSKVGPIMFGKDYAAEARHDRFTRALDAARDSKVHIEPSSDQAVVFDILCGALEPIPGVVDSNGGSDAQNKIANLKLSPANKAPSLTSLTGFLSRGNRGRNGSENEQMTHTRCIYEVTIDCLTKRLERNMRLSGVEKKEDRVMTVVYNELLHGRREQAGKTAMANGMYAHALVISNSIGQQNWSEVVSNMSLEDSLFDGAGEKKESDVVGATSGDGLYVAYNPKALQELFRLFSGSGVSKSKQTPASTLTQAIAQGPNAWQQMLLLALANRTSGDEQFLQLLGDELHNEQRHWAASLCYLLATPTGGLGAPDQDMSRHCLIGADAVGRPSTFFKNLASLQATELYECIVQSRFGNSLSIARKAAAASQLQTPEACADLEAWKQAAQIDPCALCHAQAYKLIAAHWMADLGYQDAARAYCESVSGFLKWYSDILSSWSAGTLPIPMLSEADQSKLNMLGDYLTSTLQPALWIMNERVGANANSEVADATNDPAVPSGWISKKIGFSLNKDSIKSAFAQGLDKLVTGEGTSQSEGQALTAGNSGLAAPQLIPGIVTPPSDAMSQQTSVPPSIDGSPYSVAQASFQPQQAVSATYPPPGPAAPPMSQILGQPPTAAPPQASGAPSAKKNAASSLGIGYADLNGSMSSAMPTNMSTAISSNVMIASPVPQPPKAQKSTEVNGYEVETPAVGFTPQPNGYSQGYQASIEASSDNESRQLSGPLSTQSDLGDNVKPQYDDNGLANSKRPTIQPTVESVSSKSDSDESSHEEKSGWIGKLFSFSKKGNAAQQPKAKKAIMGLESNPFYFDEKLKRWVNKTMPLEEQLQAEKPPPPPPMASAPSRSDSENGGISDVSRASTPAPSSMRAPKRGRSRYVDIMAGDTPNSPTPSRSSAAGANSSSLMPPPVNILGGLESPSADGSYAPTAALGLTRANTDPGVRKPNLFVPKVDANTTADETMDFGAMYGGGNISMGTEEETNGKK